MDKNTLDFWLTLVGTVCWGVCFWWMHRISRKQNALLAQLREQGQRIEKLSKIEHDLIKQVHPQVGEIKDGMEEMIAAVRENREGQSPVAKSQALNRSGRRKALNAHGENTGWHAWRHQVYFQIMLMTSSSEQGWRPCPLEPENRNKSGQSAAISLAKTL